MIVVLFCTSCEDFLDTKSYTQKDDSNFPINDTDVDQMITAVYTVLRGNSWLQSSEFYGDDRYGGGGFNDRGTQANDHFLYTNVNSNAWTTQYRAIARANDAIKNIHLYTDEKTRNQREGEILFIRSMYYFELAMMFGDCPIIDEAPSNVQESQTFPPMATQEELYRKIATDLKRAYDIMPSDKWDQLLSGRATKWSAAALLARVYLFYTGFYEQTSLPTQDGSDITKAQVISALEDCMQNSGHALVSDFRSLWPYSNSLTKIDYPFVADAPEWIRDGENPEHVFVVKYTHNTTHAIGASFATGAALNYGIRNNGSPDRYHSTFPIGQGWGNGPVTWCLWDDWVDAEPTDMRRAATIWNAEEETPPGQTYAYGGDSQMEETGLWQKKIIATTAYKEDRTLWKSFFSSTVYYGDGLTDNYQLAHENDIAIIRYADVLLMHSELSETVDGMNQVRARVDLPPVAAYSLDAIKKERRHELACEGIRWSDIRRWHIAEEALQRQVGKKIWNRGVQMTMKDQGDGYAKRYRDTKGFQRRSQSEIDLSGGVLKQNEGWGPEHLYTSWQE